MKNVLFFIIIFTSCIINSSEEPITKEIWRNNFDQINKSNDTIQRWKKLGYNPNITLLEKPNRDDQLIQQSGPTLFIHGWGDCQDSYKTYNLCFSNDIPGDVITFNFPDAAYCYQDIRYWMPITKSSFAGKPDITLCIKNIK